MLLGLSYTIHMVLFVRDRYYLDYLITLVLPRVPICVLCMIPQYRTALKKDRSLVKERGPKLV